MTIDSLRSNASRRVTRPATVPAAIRNPQDRGLDSLVFDLVEWVGKEPRTYAQVMEAWRTSCPRLAVWEEAIDRRYLVRRHDSDGTVRVRVTAVGRTFLLSRCVR
jgi:hypothetical protein